MSGLRPSSNGTNLPRRASSFKLARVGAAGSPFAGSPFTGMLQGAPLKVPQLSEIKHSPSKQPAYLTPSSHAGSSHIMSPVPSSSGSGAPKSPTKSRSKLDQYPVEKLQAMLVKNQSEKIALLEKRLEAGDGDDEDDLGEDPEMLDMKLKLLTTRVKELQAAIASRSQPSSSGSRSAVVTPTHVRPTRVSPPAVSAPPAHVTPAHGGPIYDIAGGSAARLAAIGFNSDPGPKQSRQVLIPDSPPAVDMLDMEMAEEDWEDPPEELVPPSSPPPPPPSRTRSTKRAPQFVMMGNPVGQTMSSPPRATPSRPPVRIEASPARSDLPRVAPSSASSKVTSREVAVEVKHKWSKEVEQKLRQVFKLPRFRTHQKEAIDETMAGRDVFVLMPTGGGKSLTYQLPAICSTGETKGVTFVVSPLISLINDQTRHLIKRNIPAIAYTGDLTATDKRMANEELSRPEPYTKVVYVTPEMLTMGGQIKNIIRDLIRRKRLARFVIDEAHCVSAWGHDFRSDYLRLGELRKDYPGIPIMALTATAPNKVQEDIIRTLGITGCSVLKQSFNRPNLHYEVRPKLKKVLHDIAAFIGTQEPGASGIVYCSSREKCETLAKELRDNHNVKAWHYHAGMSKGDRRKVQEGWQEHKFEVIVATVAFGMGIDKPDVRYVIHHSLPRSLEGYYQETGRAGRDGKNSTCILFYSYGDSKTVFNMINRDTNLNPQQKERQRDNMREVLRFCNNKTDCRRSQVLAFFNETFDAVNCHQGCDVCLGRDENRFTVKDVTSDAQNVIKMIQAFDSRDKITILNAVDCFRGTNGNNKGLDSNPMFGVGKDWPRDDAQRLITTLVIEGGLGEKYLENGAGWSNAYLRPGLEANMYLNRGKALKMDFRLASPRKSKTTKKGASDTTTPGQARLVPLAQQAKSKQMLSATRKRSRQELLEEEQAFDDSPWGDTDEEEPIEEFEDKGGARTDDGGKRRKSSGAGDNGEGGPVEQCLADLRKLRDKHASGPTPVLSEETLQMVAAIMPANMQALSKVEGITPEHVKAYGSKILGITLKYINKARVATNTTTTAGTGAATRTSSTLTRRRTIQTTPTTPASVARPIAGTSMTDAYKFKPAPVPEGRGRLSLARTGSGSTPRF